VWLFLLDELDSIRRSDTTRVKNFVTSRKDHYREPYGRRARDFKRQNVFCGTTNEHEYLPGGTNRRFWPVRVKRAVDVAAVVRDRAQLWAEAVTRYESKEKWHADTPELRALCDEQQRLRQSEDAWLQPIATWLKGQPLSMGILTHDILEKCLDSKRSDNKDSDVMRVGKIMRLLGYERGQQKRENGEQVRRWYLTTPQ
jgi:putative DNA primase/helicase